MEETKVGESEGERGKWVGMKAERRMKAGSNRGTESGRALMLERRREGGREGWSVGAK